MAKLYPSLLTEQKIVSEVKKIKVNLNLDLKDNQKIANDRAEKYSNGMLIPRLSTDTIYTSKMGNIDLTLTLYHTPKKRIKIVNAKTEHLSNLILSTESTPVTIYFSKMRNMDQLIGEISTSTDCKITTLLDTINAGLTDYFSKMRKMNQLLQEISHNTGWGIVPLKDPNDSDLTDTPHYERLMLDQSEVSDEKINVKTPTLITASNIQTLASYWIKPGEKISSYLQ